VSLKVGDVLKDDSSCILHYDVYYIYHRRSGMKNEVARLRLAVILGSNHNDAKQLNDSSCMGSGRC
jgi:hypothetical protein